MPISGSFSCFYLPFCFLTGYRGYRGYIGLKPAWALGLSCNPCHVFRGYMGFQRGYSAAFGFTIKTGINAHQHCATSY